MDDEYNPFQSPAAQPPESYPIAQSYHQRRGPRFESGQTRAVFALALLGAVVLFDVVCIGMYGRQYDVLTRLEHGERFDHAKLVADDQQLTSFEETKPILILAAAVTFLIWVHRAYRNLASLGDPVPAASPAWAVGCYFVPFANLVVPYTIMAEIWRYSDPAQFGVIRKSTSPLVAVWWCLFIGRILPFFAARMMVARRPLQPSLDELKLLTLWAIGAYVVELAAAIMALMLVRRIDSNQRTMNDLIAAQPPVESANPMW